MNKQAIEEAISEQLALRKKSVFNRNAIGALFGAFSDPIGALGKVFVGRNDVIDTEKQRIAQDVMIELLCKIDDAISQAAQVSAGQGVTINGFIETSAHGAESVVGVHIAENSGAVILQPGTHIRTSATSSKNVTGLQIGGMTTKE
jgi:hypothetical protein